MGALVAVAAGTATQAATVSATVTNVIQNISLALTIYPSNTITVGDKKDDVLDSKLKSASLTTKSVLQAITSATGLKVSSAAKLVLFTTYHVTNVFTVQYTNITESGTNFVTNLVTFTSDNTNYAGLTNFERTIATNAVFTNTDMTPILGIDDGGTLLPLTNRTPYNSYDPLSPTTLNTNQEGYSFVFGSGPFGGLYNGSNDWYFNGTTKASNGAAIFGSSSGTTYGRGISISLIAPTNLTLYGSASVGSTMVVTKNLGTAKAPVYVNYLDGTWSVSGSGSYLGQLQSSVDTNTTPSTTNVWVTNSIPFMFKGTVSATLNKIGGQ